MQNRTTNENIQTLDTSQVFVFGSNESGWHGGGAARHALLRFGAIYGNPHGSQGKSYAIPTKSRGIERTLIIEEIKPYVDCFIEYAISNTDTTFLVTEIACGLAGYNPIDIAPLFQKSIEIHNIHLPSRFWDILNSQNIPSNER